MKIDELDEFQGLTPNMVREWLKRTGWELRTDEWKEKRWFNGNGRSIADKRVLVKDGFRWIASQSVQTVQALLCEINPRMRKGVPSKAALRAHRGLWLRSIGTETIATVLSRLIDEFPSPRDNESYFWPCDANGNKVRWPTDAQGNML